MLSNWGGGGAQNGLFKYYVFTKIDKIDFSFFKHGENLVHEGIQTPSTDISGSIDAYNDADPYTNSAPDDSEEDSLDGYDYILPVQNSDEYNHSNHVERIVSQNT